MSYIVPREKPKCYNCPFRTLDYCGLLIEHDCVTVNVNEMTVSKYCPLVEIPTPHGRLVDVDDFMRHLISNVADLRTLSTGTVGKALHDTPTIVEAEEVME